MRYLTILVVASLAAGVLVGSAASAGSASATLSLIRAQPLTVRGTSFRPHERVRLVLRRVVGGGTTRVARAGAHGRFTAGFGGAQMGRCGGFRVNAIGSLGSRATLRRLPLPACIAA